MNNRQSIKNSGYKHPIDNLMRFGAQLLEKNRTRFSLWAPDADQVSVDIYGNSRVSMRSRMDGIFSVDVDCGAGTQYHYCISSKKHKQLYECLSDPASRLQAGDVHDASVVVDPNRYLWRCKDWHGRPWHEMVIYELHCGCCGGFSAITQQLSELAALGITAIELMPIADFPGNRNWGYDGVLLFAPDTRYGTPDELKNLIDTAHELNMCVYLDVVYNHFGPEGNYLSLYASDFFHKEKKSAWGKAINFDQKMVREFFTANALYWLTEYRFDGLRFDAVHAIDRPDWLDELAAYIRETIRQQDTKRYIHLMLENENNAAQHLERDFDAQWNDDAHNAMHVLLTGETESYYHHYQDQPAKKLARCLAEGFAYQGEEIVDKGKLRLRGTPSGYLSPSSFIFFLQNHDQIGNRALGERLVNLVPELSLRAAITLQLLSPQIPLLFMGEEWGERKPFLFFTDFHAELAEAVCQGRRREFADFKAFSDPKLQQQIPDPNDISTFEQSIPNFSRKREGVHRYWLDFYRTLINLRKDFISSRIPGSKSCGAKALGDQQIFASWKMGDGVMLFIVSNFSEHRFSLDRDEVETLAKCALLFQSRRDAANQAIAGFLMPQSTVVFLGSV